MASYADLIFIDRGNLDAKQLKKCLSDLQALPPLPSMADKISLFERFAFLDAVMYLDRSGSLALLDPKLQKKLDGPIFAWDAALRKGNQYYSRMSVAMRLKDRDLREKHLAEIEADLDDLGRNIRGGPNLLKSLVAAGSLREGASNAIGEILISLMVPAIRKVQHAADRTEQTQNNLHVAFALAAYKAENGQYPKNLAALAPKYLAAIPNDLFSGKALIYRRDANGYLLYSVGLNGKDDGGASRYDSPDSDGDDIAVRMPRPK
jgi:hypothetical protein